MNRLLANALKPSAGSAVQSASGGLACWRKGGLAMALVCSTGLGAMPAEAQAQPRVIVIDREQAEGGAALVLQEPIDVADDEADEALDDELLLPGMMPGFQLPMAKESDYDFLSKLSEHLDAKRWAEAFRMMTELSESQLSAIAPRGETGVYAPVMSELQRRLLDLEPEGLRAFRLYFDAQALEMLREVKDHPLPGSSEALGKLERLIERFYPTSIGGEAAAMAGDAFFERGQFARAARYWRLAIEHDQTPGDTAESLQVKRVLAVYRDRDVGRAGALYEQLAARYETLTLKVGGKPVDGLVLLSEVLAAETDVQGGDVSVAQDTLSLPPTDAQPIWNLRFLARADLVKAGSSTQNRSYYRAPQELNHFVPPVVADESRVYFAWLDAVYALDRTTGKIVWANGSIGESIDNFNRYLNNNAGDPRNYRLAQTGSDETDKAGGVVLVSRPKPTPDNNTAFALTAIDKRTGETLWSHDTLPEWAISPGELTNQLASVVGEIEIVNHRTAYAVVHPNEGADYYLRRFDPTTSEIAWTLPLGSARPMTFRYTQVRRVPQPRLLASGDRLHILIGDGMLISVNTAAAQVAWALQMEMPLRMSEDAPRHTRGNLYADQIERMSNPTGSGSLQMYDGRLYAKQHLGNTLYAVDPQTGAVQWQLAGLSLDSRLVGVDDERVYLMDRVLQSYTRDDSAVAAWQARDGMGQPMHGGAIYCPEGLLVFDSQSLKLVDTDSGEFKAAYQNPDRLSAKGGRLHRFGNLIVAIDQEQITALSMPNQASKPSE